MFSRRGKICWFLIMALVPAVVGCATQPHPASAGLPGFFSGLLHGFIMPFSLIASLFADVRIYNFPNAGRWYDFGFVIGAMMFFGGGGAAGKRKG